MESILQVAHLTKKYRNITAVQDLSFSVEKGKVYGLLGPNGSGKSTTLGMILNVVNPTSGAFTWFNGALTTAEALKKIGAIIERPNFYPYMTAYQNLELVCKIKEISTREIDTVLKTVDLYDRKHDKFKTFSLGMKQRLAIASALLNQPEMLILDEPTNGLDPKGIHEIRAIISKIAQTGATIILASHLLDEVEKVCDHVIILQKGKKIFEGQVQEMSLRNNWFEIEIIDKEKTKQLLENHDKISSVTLKQNGVKVFIKEAVEGREIVAYLAQNNLYPDSIVKKQPSLEENFLQITQ